MKTFIMDCLWMEKKYEKIKGQMNMNRAFKGTVLAGISVGFLLAGCTIETYVLTQSRI